MNRRKLLASGVAFTAGAKLSRSEAQSREPNVSGPFAVRHGDARPGGAWTVHGEKAFTTKVAGIDVKQRFAVLEIHTPPGRGPEQHIHLAQNELFYILRGRIGLQCGSERMVLNSGDSFMAPEGVPHAYVTLSQEPASMLNVFDPAGQIEGFFAAYAPLVDVAGEPDRKKLVEAYERHGMKVIGPPLSAAQFTS